MLKEKESKVSMSHFCPPGNFPEYALGKKLLSIRTEPVWRITWQEPTSVMNMVFGDFSFPGRIIFQRKKTFSTTNYDELISKLDELQDLQDCSKPSMKPILLGVEKTIIEKGTYTNADLNSNAPFG